MRDRQQRMTSDIFDIAVRNVLNPQHLVDGQARKWLDAPSEKTLKGKRDRAILATLLYHGIRR